MRKLLLLSLLLVAACEAPLPTCLPTNQDFGEIVSKKVITTRQCYFRGPCSDVDTVTYLIKRHDDSMCHTTRLNLVYEIGMKIRGPL